MLNAAAAPRIAGNLNLRLPTADAQRLLQAMPDLCISTGSACSSAEVEPSYVLRAMGLSDAEASRSLRIGIGRFTSRADIDFAAETVISAFAETSHTIQA